MVTIDNLIFTLTLFTALGCGLMAGLFFAFSVSVMKGLARLPPAEGMAAMQAINVAIINPVFLVAFLGTGAACLLLVISSLWRWPAPGAVYLLVGGVLYLVGSLLVTFIFNVPKNEALASATPSDPGSAGLWASYLASWTAWNRVRAIATLAAAASLIIALCY
jgi:uncharacterized membrane protein